MSDTENDKLFTTRMRKATRKIHSVSDALVNAKFAISLRDEKVWGGGLFVFYHIFAYLEDAQQRLNLPDFNNLFVHEILHRKKAFEEDLTHYLGDDWQSTPKSRALENYLQHLQDLEKDSPSLLMAYVYHLYLGLLSGGQILAKKRRIFGETLETTVSPEPPSDELGSLSVETQKNSTDQKTDTMQENLVLEVLENATKIASSLTKSDSEKAMLSLKAVTELSLFNNKGNLTKDAVSMASNESTSAPNPTSVIIEEKTATTCSCSSRSINKLTLTTVNETDKSRSQEACFRLKTESENNFAVSVPISDNGQCSEAEAKHDASSEIPTFSPELLEDKQKADAPDNEPSLPTNANDSIPNKPPATTDFTTTTNLKTTEDSNFEIASDTQPISEKIVEKQYASTNIQNSDKNLSYFESNVTSKTPAKPVDCNCIVTTKTPVTLASDTMLQRSTPTPFLPISRKKKKTKKEKRALAMLAAKNHQNSDSSSPVILKKIRKIERLKQQILAEKQRQLKLAAALKRQSSALTEVKNSKPVSQNDLEANEPPATIYLETEKGLSMTSADDCNAMQSKTEDAHLNQMFAKSQSKKSRKRERLRLAMLADENKQQNLNGAPIELKISKKKLRLKLLAEKQRLADLATTMAASEIHQNCATSKAKNHKPALQKESALPPITGWLPNTFSIKDVGEPKPCFVPVAGSSKRKRVSRTEDSASSTTLTFSLTASMERILQQSRKKVKASQEHKNDMNHSTFVSRQSEPRASTAVTEAMTSSMKTRARETTNAHLTCSKSTAMNELNGQKSKTNDNCNVDHIDTSSIAMNQQGPSKLWTNKMNDRYFTARAIISSNQQSTLKSGSNDAVNMCDTDSTASVMQQNSSRSWYCPVDCALFPNKQVRTKSMTDDKTNDSESYSELPSNCRQVLPESWTNEMADDYPTEGEHIPKNQQGHTKSRINDITNIFQNDSDLTSNYRQNLPPSWTNKIADNYPIDRTHKNQHDYPTSWTNGTSNIYHTDSDSTLDYRRNPDNCFTSRSPTKNLQGYQKSRANENRIICQISGVPSLRRQSGSPQAGPNECSHDHPNERADEYPTDRVLIHKNYRGSWTNDTANVSHTNSDRPSKYRQNRPQLWTNKRPNDCLSAAMSIPLNLEVPPKSRANYIISDYDADFAPTSNNRQEHPKLWTNGRTDYSTTSLLNREGPPKTWAYNTTDNCSISSTSPSMDQQNPNAEEDEKYNYFSNLDDECCVAVTTSPFYELTQEQAEYIKFKIEVASDNTVSNPYACGATKAPSFRKILFQDGVIKYWCKDCYTVNWLRHTITSIRTTCPGRVVVCKQSEIPKMHEIFIIVPNEPGKSIEDLILMVKKQNMVRYNIESWSLRGTSRVKSVSRPEKFEWVLTFGIPLEERVKLERFGRIFYKLGEMDVYFDNESLAKELPEEATLNTSVPQTHAKKNIIRQRTEERTFLKRRRPGDSGPYSYSNIPEKKNRF